MGGGRVVWGIGFGFIDVPLAKFCEECSVVKFTTLKEKETSS